MVGREQVVVALGELVLLPACVETGERVLPRPHEQGPSEDGNPRDHQQGAELPPIAVHQPCNAAGPSSGAGRRWAPRLRRASITVLRIVRRMGPSGGRSCSLGYGA